MVGFEAMSALVTDPGNAALDMAICDATAASGAGAVRSSPALAAPASDAAPAAGRGGTGSWRTVERGRELREEES